MSYSIYLWQQLFLFMNWPTTSAVKTFPLNIILVAVTALGSYFLIERPSLKLRLRLEEKLFPSKKRGYGSVPKIKEFESKLEDSKYSLP
jgi:peptidoglycan/LPS O-acetylase OafA/YrhL